MKKNAQDSEWKQSTDGQTDGHLNTNFEHGYKHNTPHFSKFVCVGGDINIERKDNRTFLKYPFYNLFCLLTSQSTIFSHVGTGLPGFDQY